MRYLARSSPDSIIGALPMLDWVLGKSKRTVAALFCAPEMTHPRAPRAATYARREFRHAWAVPATSAAPSARSITFAPTRERGMCPRCGSLVHLGPKNATGESVSRFA